MSIARLVRSCLVVCGVALFLACGSQNASEDPSRSEFLKGGKGGGGGHKPPTGEAAANNVSFPVIFSDGVGPASFPADGAWRFATITDPATQCVQEGNASATVDPSVFCYYGRHTTTISETGGITFDGAPKVWWLQQRSANFWKAFSYAYQGTLAVSAVDVGDLLESSPSIATRQIRTEFNLLQDVRGDGELGGYLNADGTANLAMCTIPSGTTGTSTNCLGALAMSGAVPGTQQSINETQGTDFGPGGDGAVAVPGTLTFADPTTVRAAVPADGADVKVHAIVYARCARLLIQRVGETKATFDPATVAWDATKGMWAGPGVNAAALVNLPAYTDAYAAEINSGGGLVYGYNWSASTATTGVYRLSFVLDGNDAVGPKCTATSKTRFVAGVTRLVNLGEANQPGILYAGDPALGDEGGIAYLDLELTAKGGGGRGGN